ncbi:MAG: hypothetical protein HYV59_09650 [Planctomycetes bacterium]|nr:hypothetical protein [Planctomycetota bacterium]
MEITEKRLIANRANSKKALGKSTGPHNTLLTRFNSIKHGMTSSLPIMLPGENEEEFKKLTTQIRDKLCPQNAIGEEIAGRIAHCIWMLRRGRTAEQAIIEKYTEIEGVRWDGLLKSNYLAKITRYENRLTQQLHTLQSKFKKGVGENLQD